MTSSALDLLAERAEARPLDLRRTASQGIVSRSAQRLDQQATILQMSVVHARAIELSALNALFPAFGDISVEPWHQEPDFVPGRILPAVAIEPPDFVDIPDGIDWG